MTDATLPAARPRKILTQIAPVSWEHPADRAALQTLRSIPGFDEVVKKIVGFFGERGIPHHAPIDWGDHECVYFLDPDGNLLELVGYRPGETRRATA